MAAHTFQSDSLLPPPKSAVIYSRDGRKRSLNIDMARQYSSADYSAHPLPNGSASQHPSPLPTSPSTSTLPVDTQPAGTPAAAGGRGEGAAGAPAAAEVSSQRPPSALYARGQNAEVTHGESTGALSSSALSAKKKKKKKSKKKAQGKGPEHDEHGHVCLDPNHHHHRPLSIPNRLADHHEHYHPDHYHHHDHGDEDLDEFYSDDEAYDPESPLYAVGAQHQPSTQLGGSHATPGSNAAKKKKKKRKKASLASDSASIILNGHHAPSNGSIHHHQQQGSTSASASSVGTITKGHRSGGTQSKHLRKSHIQNDGFWNYSDNEERQRIREFWFQLREDERRSLVRVEKEAVLKKMKEQQRHSCSCSLCGRKRTAIEEELELLYDAYYDELEQYANQQQPTDRAAIDYPQDSTVFGEEELSDEYEDEDDDEEDDDEEEEGEEGFSLADDLLGPVYEERDLRANQHPYNTFPNTLRAKGNILTVAEDLLENDGKKFLEMMDRLADRKVQRDEDLLDNRGAYDEYDDEEEGDYEDDEGDEEQRMEEGRRMFQAFAARMFEQRVLSAYREKVAQERQERLLAELEEESRQEQLREERREREKEKKRDKKRQQRLQREEERAQKEAQKLAEEKRLQEEKKRKQEEDRRRREEERRAKEEERRQQEEERLRKEEERKRKIKEEKERKRREEQEAKEQAEREAELKDKEAKRIAEEEARRVAEEEEEEKRVEQALLIEREMREQLRIERERKAMLEQELLREQRRQQAMREKEKELTAALEMQELEEKELAEAAAATTANALDTSSILDQEELVEASVASTALPADTSVSRADKSDTKHSPGSEGTSIHVPTPGSLGRSPQSNTSPGHSFHLPIATSLPGPGTPNSQNAPNFWSHAYPSQHAQQVQQQQQQQTPAQTQQPHSLPSGLYRPMNTLGDVLNAPGPLVGMPGVGASPGIFMGPSQLQQQQQQQMGGMMSPGIPPIGYSHNSMVMKQILAGIGAGPNMHPSLVNGSPLNSPTTPVGPIGSQINSFGPISPIGHARRTSTTHGSGEVIKPIQRPLPIGRPKDSATATSSASNNPLSSSFDGLSLGLTSLHLGTTDPMQRTRSPSTSGSHAIDNVQVREAHLAAIGADNLGSQMFSSTNRLPNHLQQGPLSPSLAGPGDGSIFSNPFFGHRVAPNDPFLPGNEFGSFPLSGSTGQANMSGSSAPNGQFMSPYQLHQHQHQSSSSSNQYQTSLSLQQQQQLYLQQQQTYVRPQLQDIALQHQHHQHQHQQAAALQLQMGLGSPGMNGSGSWGNRSAIGRPSQSKPLTHGTIGSAPGGGSAFAGMQQQHSLSPGITSPTMSSTLPNGGSGGGINTTAAASSSPSSSSSSAAAPSTGLAVGAGRKSVSHHGVAGLFGDGPGSLLTGTIGGSTTTNPEDQELLDRRLNGGSAFANRAGGSFGDIRPPARTDASSGHNNPLGGHSLWH